MRRSSARLLGGAPPAHGGLVAEGRADRLRRLDFFSDFGEAELWELLRCASWEEVATAHPVVREGEEGHSFYIIVEGRMAVLKAGWT